jgi:hypothetical protein
VQVIDLIEKIFFNLLNWRGAGWVVFVAVAVSNYSQMGYGFVFRSPSVMAVDGRERRGCKGRKLLGLRWPARELARALNATGPVAGLRRHTGEPMCCDAALAGFFFSPRRQARQVMRVSDFLVMGAGNDIALRRTFGILSFIRVMAESARFAPEDWLGELGVLAVLARIGVSM